MNLEKLFQKQAELDAHIEREHPTQDGEDRLAKKILALQVELGELANEARFFKYWSNDQEPRTKKEVFCTVCDGTGTPLGIPEYSGIDCYKCGGMGTYFVNPLLEEYVDCLHFILSIGLDMGIKNVLLRDMPKTKNIIYQFLNVFGAIERFSDFNRTHSYNELLSVFLTLGEQLGFTWEQIEEAYMAKNEENHHRQERGY